MIDTLTALGFCRDMLLNSDAGARTNLLRRRLHLTPATHGRCHIPTLFVDRGFES